MAERWGLSGLRHDAVPEGAGALLGSRSPVVTEGAERRWDQYGTPEVLPLFCFAHCHKINERSWLQLEHHRITIFPKPTIATGGG